MNILLKKIAAVLVIVPTIGISALGILTPTIASAETTSGSTITLVSNSNTQTAGYTETNPGSATSTREASLYSGGAFTQATATMLAFNWIDPSVSQTFNGSGAVWISTNSNWPTNSSGSEGNTANNQWK